MFNFEKLDKIIVSSKDVVDLEKQLQIIKQNNPQVQTLSHVAIVEGILSVKLDGLNHNVHIYFDISSDIFKFEVFIDNHFDKKMMKFEFNLMNQQIELHESFINKNKYAFIELAKSYVYWVTTCVLYITHCKDLDNIDVLDERVQVNKKQRHKSKNKNKYTYITRKKYTINKIEDVEKTRQQIIRHLDSWSVRGHYRKCQSGKVVWVKPHKKGKGEVHPKTYKVNL